MTAPAEDRSELPGGTEGPGRAEPQGRILMSWLVPRVVLPAGVHVIFTTRLGTQAGNLGLNVQDDPALVRRRRRALRQQLSLRHIQWLTQVHGRRIVAARPGDTCPEADASHSREAGLGLAILTADCLPVMLFALDGSEVAAVHAGWRGLADGALEAAVDTLATPVSRMGALIGPAVCQRHYEVDDRVRDAFLDGRGRRPADDAPCPKAPSPTWMPGPTWIKDAARRYDPAASFKAAPGKPGHYDLDLPGAARDLLAERGLARIEMSGLCTRCHGELFYSHRHEPRAGRFATVIWRSDDM